uniref:Ig-like domain-containing protein n=3 Tax=Nothobranchius TaxID=28779 RepID=A0A1A8BQ16_NOTKA
MVAMMAKWILIILIMTPGVWSGTWGVTLTNQCALKGTSVVLECEYDYPIGNIVMSVRWSKAQLISGRWDLIPISELPSGPDHFKYMGNYRGDCNLKVDRVQPTDEGAYFFSFVTTLNRWRSQTYAYLYVRELTAAVQPSTVAEGDTVRLSCSSGCPEQPEVAWFKDGQRVSHPEFQAGREDAGGYHCAVLGQERVRSALVVLTVHYAPKNVTLWVSPSGAIVAGDTVTLTCSSEAEPPVRQNGYSLFKDGEFISSGQRHIIQDVQPSQSGRYYCQAGNSIRWRGSDHMNSSEVHLDVLYPPINVSLSVDPPHVTDGIRVNLTCTSAANPTADNYTWFRRSATSSSSLWVQVGSGQVLSLPSMEPSHTGLYLCIVRSPLGESNSTEMMLAMEAEQQGSQSLPVLAALGVFVIVGIMLLLWKKQKYSSVKKEAEFDTRPRPVESDFKDPSDSVYSNIFMFPSSPPKVSVQVPTSHEAEVVYSMVKIKPRKPNPSHSNNSREPHDSWLQEREKDSSVIYATVKSS